jgi:hypothetical protein
LSQSSRDSFPAEPIAIDPHVRDQNAGSLTFNPGKSFTPRLGALTISLHILMGRSFALTEFWYCVAIMALTKVTAFD